jgi:hypothetical protein
MTHHTTNRHPNFKNITGQRFGRLVAVEPTGLNAHGKTIWLCKCDCGEFARVLGSNLRHGGTRSCGCLIREGISTRNMTHGMTGTKIHRIWRGILTRCTNPNSVHYSDYGGRGITVCDEWRQDFQAFYAYVSGLPDYAAKGYQIDRIDNDGIYEPGNVRWASMKQQARNRRSNVMVTFNGKTQSLTDWAEEIGIPFDTLRGRFRRGWSVKRTLTAPVQVQVRRRKI